MRLAILQPFYLPYPGVFEQIRLADVFVFYDDVQFVPRSWQSRNRILTAQGPTWLTVPVRTKGQHRPAIDEVRIDDGQGWRQRHLRTIQHAYARAEHHDWLWERLEPVYAEGHERLADLNIALTRRLCSLLAVDARFLRSSELGVSGTASQRILDHCLEVGASRYLTGLGARDYLDERSFAAKGIELEYFEYDDAHYPQLHGAFVERLSVVDLLANVGPEAATWLPGRGRAVPADAPGPS